MTDGAPNEMRAWRSTGRGYGWLAAHRAGLAAAEDVVGLVLDDPRWDRQVEQRASYYATLLSPLEVDVTRIAERVRERTDTESDVWLAIAVLGELSRRGHAGALAALRVAASGPHGRQVEDELALMTRQASSTRPSPQPAVDAIQDCGDPRGRLDDIERALREDAQRGADAPQGAPRPGGRARAASLRVLVALPPELTLPRARAWLDAPWPLSLAAERVLADHAVQDDRSLIEARVAEAHGSRSYYRLCSLVDALGTIGHVASVRLLCTIHDEVVYSYARGRALIALSVHSGHEAVRERLREGLWDCDAIARETAADGCDVSDPVVHARLTALAHDPHEHDDVRETAAAALRGDP